MPSKEFAPGLEIQGFTPPLKLKDFKLIAFDMDSTLINIECVDEIADAVGMKDQVAAITEAAMRGEITDYKESLRRRVALLQGVTVADMEQVYTERLQLNPGAETLVKACQAAGLKTLLVSGGFTFFTDRIRDKLAIDFTRSNVLEIRSGANCGELTGRMVDQPWGDVCDGAEKRKMLLETCAQLGIAPRQAIPSGPTASAPSSARSRVSASPAWCASRRPWRATTSSRSLIRKGTSAPCARPRRARAWWPSTPIQ